MKRFHIRYFCPTTNLQFESGANGESATDVIQSFESQGYTNVKILNGYQCFYNGNTIDVYAETPLEARSIACKKLKLKMATEIIVMLCELQGEEYLHSTGSI
jgi:hypothetical protein